MKLVLPPPRLGEIMALTVATTAIKWAVQYQRKRGATTPTVFVNGIENGICSSGWDAAKWRPSSSRSAPTAWRQARLRRR